VLALAERPDFIPAGLGLADLQLVQGRPDEAEPVVARVEAAPQADAEGAVLRARLLLARGALADARRRLEAAVARHPQALAPRVALSHALLQAGTDPAAAERALRAVLALEPAHAEARHNLAVLLGQAGGAQ
jgi:Flp pilus assembly protein TadD